MSTIATFVIITVVIVDDNEYIPQLVRENGRTDLGEIE